MNICGTALYPENWTQLRQIVLTCSQHSQMLVVRKEGKAHDKYNSFRSAFELLESVGREPHDCFEELSEDMPPLQRLEVRVEQLCDSLADINNLKTDIDMLKTENQNLKNAMDILRVENEALKSVMDVVETENQTLRGEVDKLRVDYDTFLTST